jgi:hypothetical protein
MGDLIKMSDWKGVWKEAYAQDVGDVSVQAYVNVVTQGVELVLQDSEETIRIPMTMPDFMNLVGSVKKAMTSK